MPAGNEGGCETCHGDSALYRASGPLVVSALLASDAEILPGAEADHPYIWDLPSLLTALGVFTEVCISSPCCVTGCGVLRFLAEYRLYQCVCDLGSVVPVVDYWLFAY